MKRNTFVFFFLLLGLVWTAAAHPTAIQAAPSADAVVGDGTPASCTEENFDAALKTVQDGGGGTITFACGDGIGIPFTSAKLITADVIISGDNRISLNGNGFNSRLFIVNQALTLNDITLMGGYAGNDYGGAILVNSGGELLLNGSSIQNSSTATGFAGGAIIDFGGRVTLNYSSILNNSSSWGAINSTGTLTLTNTLIKGNEAIGGGGGGLSVGGTVFIRDSQIISNTTDGNGGGIYATPSANITIIDSQISGNTAGQEGGGIYFDGSTAALYRVKIDTNHAHIGGGLSIFGPAADIFLKDTSFSHNDGGVAGGGLDSDGKLIGERVTFDHNTASQGGGIRNDAGTITLQNSTFSQNIGNYGGGFYNDSGQATLTFVTFAFNQSEGSYSDSIYHSGLDSSNTLTLQNVVMAHNELVAQAVNCWIADGSVTSITSNGHNLADDESCPLNQPTDTLNTDPLLGALSYDYSFTQIHLPLEGSPLIDAGQCIEGIITDQRGRIRPQGVTCDIGAVERQPSNTDGFFIFLPVIIR